MLAKENGKNLVKNMIFDIEKKWFMQRKISISQFSEKLKVIQIGL